MTVLTEYNNETYRIDDVDFNINPMTTFKKRDQDVTIRDYYAEVSGLALLPISFGWTTYIYFDVFLHSFFLFAEISNQNPRYGPTTFDHQTKREDNARWTG